MFKITTQADEVYEVKAETVEAAARRHGKAACGIGRRGFVKRTTGTPGFPGWFQAYVPCEGSGTSNYTSTSKPFHVGPTPTV